VLDVQTHRLSIVNAGHPYPMIRRRDGSIEEVGASISGLPLAIMGDYPYEAAETTLEPGETMILFSDGVTDAMNARNDRFSEGQLRQALSSARGATAAGEAIVKAVQRHVGEQSQFDDITLVCLARR